MGDFEKLAMAQVKCAQCGASIGEGDKFCKHCGTKVPDNVFRAHIQIDDTADIRRVQYEEKESILRQKEMQREFRRRKALRIVSGVFLVIGVIALLLGFFALDHTKWTGPCAFAGVGGIAIAAYIAFKNLFNK